MRNAASPCATYTMVCEQCEHEFCMTCESTFGCGHSSFGLGILCWPLRGIAKSPTTGEKICFTTTLLVFWPMTCLILAFAACLPVFTYAWALFIRYGFCKVLKCLWKSDEDDELGCCEKYVGRIVFILICPILLALYETVCVLGIAFWFSLASIVFPYLAIVGQWVFIYKLCTLKKLWLTRDDDI